MDATKRKFLLLMAALLLGCGGRSAFGKDGEGGGGGGGGHSGPGGGGGGDDDDDRDDDDDEGDDDSGGGSGSGSSGSGGHRRRRRREQDRVLDAVASGQAVPLIELKAFLAENYPGKILKVDLVRRFGSFVYRVRILAAGNRVQRLTLDAKTLQRRWL